MKYKKLMILAIFLVSLLAISAVNAADNATSDVVSVEETTDKVVSVEENQVFEQTDEGVIGEVDNGTFKALRYKINNAVSGSTLILENDYVFNEDTDKELFYGDDGWYVKVTPRISNKDLTIDGKCHTIDANHLNSILGISGQCNVVLKNINFKNGYYYDSINRISTSAVYVGSDVNLYVVGCSFENCHNNIDGGAVTFYSGGHGSLTDCSFLNCSSETGGAIYKEGDVVDCIDVVGCSFIDCSSINYGGAIYGADNVVGCNFTNCFGIGDANWGAAISGGSVVSNCNFINCSNNNVGGAIFDADEVIDCNFRQCTSRNGAAIRSAQNVKGCSFIDCSSLSEEYAAIGGAIDKAHNVVNCYFRNCSASEGGAIYDVDNVDGCTFIGCYADEGGAIYEPRNVTNSNFTNNVADKGDAMYIDYYYNPIITNCNFKDSSKNGQLFFYKYLTYYCDSYSRCILSNLNFEGNELNYAGGISFANNVLTVVGDKQYLPSNSGNNIDLSKLVYLSGDVTVNIAGKTFKTALDSGIAKFDLNTIADGTYDATILYSGCDVAPPLEIKIPLTIKSNIKIQANDLVKYCGGSEKYTVTVTNGNVKLSGVNVNFRVNGKTQTTKTDSNGQATIPVDLPVGTYDVVNTYNGASATSKVTVKSTLVTSDVNGTYLNSKVSATFLDTAGKALASKQITFKIGTSSYSATTDSNGVASANIPLGVGTYTVTAVNPASKEEKQFKLTISKASSTTRLTAVQNGKSVTLTAALTPNAATGKVTFEINGKTQEASISNGKASATFSDLSPNTYPATATYSGDANFKSSSATASVKVDKVYSIVDVSDVEGLYLDSEVSATFLDANGKALANTKVTFKVGGKSYTATTNSYGVATASIDLDVGTYDVTVVNPDTNEEKQFKLTIINPNAKIVPLNLNGEYETIDFDAEYETGTFTFKLVDFNTNQPLQGKKLTLSFLGEGIFGMGSVATDEYGIATFDNRNLNLEKIVGGKMYEYGSIDAGTYFFVVNGNDTSIIASEIGYYATVGPKINIKTNPYMEYEGSAKQFIINVTNAKTGEPMRGIVLHISINDTAYGDYYLQTDENGIARIDLSALTPGNYQITISNNDTKNIVKKKVYETITILDAPSKVNPVLSAESISLVYGNNKNLVVNVKDADGTPIANRDVYLNIFIGNNLYNSYSGQSDENGQLKFSAKVLKPNTYMVYINSDDCKEITAKITVKKATPKLTANAKTFKKSLKTKKYTVTLKTNTNKVMKNTKVTLKVNGKTYSATTNAKGQATFKITKLTKKGKFTGTIAYKGNAYYNKLSKKVKITIK